MIPPENAWLRRSNDAIIIGCYSSQQTWQLKCNGREWKGLVGTCPEMCTSGVHTLMSCIFGKVSYKPINEIYPQLFVIDVLHHMQTLR